MNDFLDGAENIDKKSFNNPIYTKGSVFWGSLVGGPAAGCYLMGKNFESLGDTVRGKKVFKWGIIIQIVFFVLSELILNLSGMENRIFTWASLGLATGVYYYFVLVQNSLVITYLRGGNSKYSIFRSLAISLLILLLTYILSFIAANILIIFFA